MPTSLPLFCRLVAVAALSSAALAAAGCTEDAARDAPAPRVLWLFSLDAASASVTEHPGGAVVKLIDPGDSVVFTDRPAREAQRVRAQWLAGAWSELFAGDPPDAVLSGLDASGRHVDAVVEIVELHGDARELSALVRGVGPDADKVLPSRLFDVELFVDDVSASKNRIFSIPASSLVEPFSDNHRGSITDGVSLGAATSLSDGAE